MKTMPEEVYKTMGRADRIVAHLEHNYELDEEDMEYFEKITMVFKIIHGAKNDEVARKKIMMVLGAGNHRSLIDAATVVYGDFFVINQAAMRVIQEKRHEQVYQSAMISGDYASAQRCLASIDRLHRLYDKGDSQPITNRRLPKVRRTSDPEALKKLYAAEPVNEDEADD